MLYNRRMLPTMIILAILGWTLALIENRLRKDLARRFDKLSAMYLTQTELNAELIDKSLPFVSDFGGVNAPTNSRGD